MSTTDTGHPATCVVYTPTGTVPCCERHAATLRAIVGFLGAHTETMPAADGAQCSNCVNEAKARERMEAVR